MIEKQYIDGDYKYTEFANGTKIKELISNEVPLIDTTEPQPTLEDIAQATLFETQYQTIMLEMLSGF